MPSPALSGAGAETGAPSVRPSRRLDRPRRLIAGAALAGVLVVLAGCTADPAEDDGREGRQGQEGAPDQETGAEWTAYPRLDAAIAVAPAADGGVWTGTRTAGLVRWDASGEDYRRPPPPDGIDTRHLSALVVADDGALWVAAADPRAAEPAGAGAEPAPADGADEPEGDGDAESDPQGGVARFDGQQWRRWTAASGLAHEAVVSLAVAGDGSVWAATPEGLSRFEGDEWTTHTAADGLAHDRVLSVAAGGDTVWAITRGERAEGGGGPGEPAPSEFGLSRFDGGDWTHWTTDGDLDADSLGALAVADDGSAWMGVGFAPSAPQDALSGIARFDGQRWQTWTGGPGDLGVGSDALAIGQDGAVWTSTRHGPARFDDGEWDLWDITDGLATERVSSLATAEDRTVWAATPEGVAHFDGEQWTVWRSDVSPPGKIDSLAVADDTVWAGLGLDGIGRFDGQRWTTDTVRDSGLQAPQGYSVAAGDDGTVWAGSVESMGGMARFDDGEWISHTPPEGQFDDDRGAGHRITDVAVGDGAVWGVTEWGAIERGVVRFDGRQWTRWTADDGLPDTGVDTLAVGDDTVWAGSREAGVWRLEGDRWTLAAKDENRALPGVTALAVGSDTVWAATRRPGVWGGFPRADVWRLDGDEWTTVGSDDVVGGSRVTSMAVADDGTVWVGTAGATRAGQPAGGVSAYDGGEWTTWTADDGLAGNAARAVAVGDDGTVWVGGRHGLSRFIPAQ